MKGLLESALSSARLFKYQLEPRDFGEYSCRKCHSRGIRPEDVRYHVEVSPGCGGDPIHSGPDAEVFWSVVERLVYDYTTIHLTCASKLRYNSSTAIKQLISDKVSKYVTSGQIPASEFRVVVGFSSGGVSDDLLELLRRLAAVSNLPTDTIVQQFAVLIQQEQARAVILAHQANAKRARWRVI